jgi:hypothetical protein
MKFKASDLNLDPNADCSQAIHAAIQTYGGITIDCPLTLSGSILDGGGKTIQFDAGGYFGGQGSIINYIHGSSYKQECYSTAIAIAPLGTTSGKISPAIYGARPDGTDASLAVQLTANMCIAYGDRINTMIVPAGRYTFLHPLFLCKFTNGEYVFWQLRIQGDNTYSSADGYGTQFDFSKCAPGGFGIGLQNAKGFKMTGIKLIGGANYVFNTARQFYTTKFEDFKNVNGRRDSWYSPECAFVPDAFGPHIPSDGGYQGTLSTGESLTSLYRGTRTNGSTGIEVDDCFWTNWVGGLVNSPNGQTSNGEMIKLTNMHFANMKFCIAGCQAQERLNILDGFQAWDSIHTIFVTAQYGAGSVGQWIIRNGNIAGLVNRFAYNNQGGYYSSFFENIVAESIREIGFVKSTLGTTFKNCNWNFAYTDELTFYSPGQVNTPGCTHIGGAMRMYGSGKPITIDGTIAASYFENVAFETVPIYTLSYPRGFCSFKNCTVGDTGILLNPNDIQVYSPTEFQNSIAYGDTKIKSAGQLFHIESSVAADALPLNIEFTTPNYQINIDTGSYQAVIQCPHDELVRVKIGDSIVGFQTPQQAYQYKIVGVVTATDPVNKTFTISYVSDWIVSGQNYYLFVWLPLHNISFTGDVTKDSNVISNVVSVAGYLPYFVLYGGMIKTNSLTVTDWWHSKSVRILSYDPGARTITMDKTSTVTVPGVSIVNTDATSKPFSF